MGALHLLRFFMMCASSSCVLCCEVALDMVLSVLVITKKLVSFGSGRKSLDQLGSDGSDSVCESDAGGARAGGWRTRRGLLLGSK